MTLEIMLLFVLDKLWLGPQPAQWELDLREAGLQASPVPSQIAGTLSQGLGSPSTRLELTWLIRGKKDSVPGRSKHPLAGVVSLEHVLEKTLGLLPIPQPGTHHPQWGPGQLGFQQAAQTPRTVHHRLFPEVQCEAQLPSMERPTIRE